MLILVRKIVNGSRSIRPGTLFMVWKLASFFRFTRKQAGLVVVRVPALSSKGSRFEPVKAIGEIYKGM